MTVHFMKTLRTGAAAFALAIAAPVLVMPLSLSAYAQTQDVLLENIEAPGAKIAKVEIKGTNVTQEQAQQLFAGTLPADQMQALATTLVAASIAIDGVNLTPPEGGSITMDGIAIENIAAAEGTLGSLVIGKVGLTDVPSDGQKINGEITNVTLKGVAAKGLIEALNSGDISTIIGDPTKMPKFEQIAIGTSRFQGPVEGGVMDITLASAVVNVSNFIGNVGTNMDYSFQNMVIKPPAGSEQATQLKALGYDELDLSMSGKAAWDKDSKVYALSDMVIDWANGAKLTINANLGNVDEAAFMGDPQTTMMAMLSAGVTDAKISLENNGLAEKGFAFAGQMQGKDGAAMQAEAAGMAGAMLPMFLGQDEGAQKIIAAVNAFVTSPKNITVSAKAKSGMLTAQDFAAVATPADIFAKIDVEAAANE
jgi:hypothetical protein